MGRLVVVVQWWELQMVSLSVDNEISPYSYDIK